MRPDLLMSLKQPVRHHDRALLYRARVKVTHVSLILMSDTG